MEAASGPLGDDKLREEAIKAANKKRDFRTHLVVYVLVNAMLVAIWAFTGADFFWPIFPMAGWGIAVLLNAWDVYGRKPLTEGEIQREMERLRH